MDATTQTEQRTPELSLDQLLDLDNDKVFSEETNKQVEAITNSILDELHLKVGADGQLVGEDENSNLDYGDSLFVKNASLEEAGQVFKEVTDVGEMDIPFQKFLRNSESHRSFTRAEKLFRTLMVINFILMVSVPLLAEQLPRLEVVTCLASFCFLLLNFFAASDIAVRVDRRRVEAEMRDFVRLNKLDIGEDRESLTQLRDAALVPENAKAREMLRKLKDSLRGK